MRKLTPLEQVTTISAALRKQLATFWITSVEEFVSTARSGNQQYGSGGAALAVALGISKTALDPLVSAATGLLPRDVSFGLPVEQEFGAGLFLEQYRDLEAVTFDAPVGLPEKVEPLFALPKPINQGVRNTCVAFTLAAAYQIVSKDPTDLSEQFLYWACKQQDGIPGDVGTDPLKAAQVLQNMGICTERVWPYKPSPRNDQNPGYGPPPQAALSEATLRRVKRFDKLAATSFNSLKAALAAGKPVLIGLRIWEHWTSSWQGSTLGRLRAQLPGEQQRGGHAMCVVGYRDDQTAPGGGYFIVRNSWGSDWGKENPDGPGYCHVPYKLVADQGLAAIAFEGVINSTAPASTTSSGQPTKLGKSGSKGSLGGAATSLAGIYDEARAIQTRLNSLVENLATLVNAEATPSAAPAPAPAEAAPSVVAAPARAEQATPPVATPKSFVGAPALLRELLSSVPDPKNVELYPNGLSPEGKPLLRIDALTASQFAQGKAGGEPKELLALYKAKHNASSVGHLGMVSDLDPNKLEQARWAVVINAQEDAALIKAIWPLIEHRMRQMGQTPPTVSFNPGESAGVWLNRHTNGSKQTLKDSWGKIPPVLLYRPDERVNPWLARHGVSNGPVDPRRGVPFYLMLVGRPGPLNDTDTTYIPFTFQYELDIFWGVGRICFAGADGQHRLADYTAYAERLVQFEQRQDAASRLRKEIVYFATRHEGDTATIRSADELVRPLTDWATNPENIPLKRGFAHTLHREADATRATFEAILRGGSDGKAPALLFTASHGLGLPLSDDRLPRHQGSLVLGDWSGIGNVKREHWFAGEDLTGLSGGPKVEGTLAFLFACYGAGCPPEDEFIFDANQEPPRIAPFALIGQLPQQLLVNGALGVLGHIERAWTYGFSSGAATSQSQPFEDVLGRLMQGRRVGDATDQFNVIQGARATALVDELTDIKYGKTVDPLDLAQLWIARNDARNYALLGDPAARLPYA